MHVFQLLCKTTVAVNASALKHPYFSVKLLCLWLSKMWQKKKPKPTNNCVSLSGAHSAGHILEKEVDYSWAKSVVSNLLTGVWLNTVSRDKLLILSQSICGAQET